MLKIRPEQIKVFEANALRKFEDEMVGHSKEFTPRLCKVLGDAQLRVALHQAMQRATYHGFTNRGPMRLYIELMFLCGSHFDTDPQYAVLGKILNTAGDQMQRADQIYEGLLDYQKNVSGPDAIYVHRALEALGKFARKPLILSSDNFEEGIAREIKHAFPQKVIYVGKEGLTQLIQDGRSEAQKYGFPITRGEALLVVLKFAFGHGCTNDPLYPWIWRTINDDRIVNPLARAKRLEKKALTWLDHVLARTQKRLLA